MFYFVNVTALLDRDGLTWYVDFYVCLIRIEWKNEKKKTTMRDEGDKVFDVFDGDTKYFGEWVMNGIKHFVPFEIISSSR